MKAADDWGNLSGLSNVVSKTTLTPPPGAWSVEIVDAASLHSPDRRLAYDSDGNPAIVYDDSGSGQVKFAHFNGSSWDLESVAAGRDVDLVFDPLSGEPTISFTSDNSLMFGRFDGITWNIQEVTDRATLGDTSLAYDGDGHPSISYRVNMTTGRGRNKVTLFALMLARFDGSSWSAAAVDAEVSPLHSSLAFDSDGNPTIAYNTGTPGSLMFAQFDGDSWSTEIVDSNNIDNIRIWVSLAYDPVSGTPAIAYTVSGDGIRFPSLARWNGSAWEFEAADAGRAYYADSLVHDSLGVPYIGYHAYESSLMNVAHLDRAAWDIDAVETGNGILGRSSLAFDPDANPTVSYFDDEHGLLKFARKLPAP